MDVGSTLRAARERHGLTLAHLASTTKIPVGVLQAIEGNDFDRVPRGIFVRGFIRAYAAQVGLDATDLVAQFRRESGEAIAAPAAPTEVAIDDDIEPASVDANAAASGPGLGYLVIIAALLVAFLVVSRDNEDSSGTDAATDAILADAPSIDAARAGAAANAAPAAAVPPVATAGHDLSAAVGDGGTATATLRFDLQADGECWVEAIVDGQRQVYRLMQPGERTTIESDHEIVLRVGDPGALTYFVNGTRGKPLGRAGVPVTVTFTNQGA